MPQISIDTETVQQGHTQFLSASSSIHESLGQIKSALDLISGSFHGPGADQFVLLMTEWHTDSTKVTSALDDITVRLNKVVESFGSLDQSILNAFK